MPMRKLRWLRRRGNPDASAGLSAERVDHQIGDDSDFGDSSGEPAEGIADGVGEWADAPRMHPKVISYALGVAIIATLVIGAAAFVFSFSAQQALAIEFGAEARFAWLVPVMIDGAILSSSICVISLSHHLDQWTVNGRRFIRRIEYSAATVSVVMNGGHAFMTQTVLWRGFVAAIIGALAPIFLLAMTEAVEILVRAPRHIAVAAHTRPERRPQWSGSASGSTQREPLIDATVGGASPAELEPVGERRIEIPTEEGDALVAAALIEGSADPHIADGKLANAFEDVMGQRSAPAVADLLRQVPTEFSDDKQRREWALWLRGNEVKVPTIAERVNRSQATVYRWLNDARETRQLVPQSHLVRAS